MTPLPLPSDPPPLFKDLLVEPEEARSILRPQKDERYGFGFALSPYRGCSHGCRYCYVREYPNALHRPEDWGGWVAPKLNAPELLWSQRHKLHDARVFMASATDPYQPLERHYRLSRRCLEVLLLCPTTEVIVHTRSPLVLQDLDLLRAFGDRLSVGLSIPTDDDTVRQIVEPQRTRHPQPLGRGGASGGRPASRSPSAWRPSWPCMIPGLCPARQGQRRLECLGGRAPAAEAGPFYKLLADHGWLKVLDPDYRSGIRAAFLEAFPRESASAKRGWNLWPRRPPR